MHLVGSYVKHLAMIKANGGVKVKGLPGEEATRPLTLAVWTGVENQITLPIKDCIWGEGKVFRYFETVT